MAYPLKPLNLTDFRGGLNLRADAFTLEENESPEMLNVDMDVRAGIKSRRDWARIHTTVATVDFTRLHNWQRVAGSSLLMAATDAAGVWYLSGSTAFTELQISSVSLDVQAEIIGADFVPWGDDIYIIGGRSGGSYRWDGTGDADELDQNTTTWQDDYTTVDPLEENFVPAEFGCAYSGYMVLANTYERAAAHPNRIRFSHPNDPENWRENDYIDIDHGGQKITGIIPFSDHILVMKTESMWAIYGYDATSFAAVQLAGDTGCPHRNAMCVGIQTAYFWSVQNGVMEYAPGQGIRELSPTLRTAWDSSSFNSNDLSGLFFGWMNRRLWVGAPYKKDDTAPTDPGCVFVFEPRLDAWTKYIGGNDQGLGPFATGGEDYAYSKENSTVVEVDADLTGKDDFDGTPVPFDTLYATKWLDAGLFEQRKSWRRPTYMVTEMEAPYTLTVEVMRNNEEANVRNRHDVYVETGSDTVLWGDGTWGDGTLWGVGAAGSHKERGGSIGLADSIQLRIINNLGEPWGINAIMMKYKNRRFR